MNGLLDRVRRAWATRASFRLVDWQDAHQPIRSFHCYEVRAF